MDCLDHLIDDRGIHADSDKMSRIHGWRTPRNKHDVQRFLGLVQYLAHFMPDVSAYTGPLATLQKNSHLFLWKPMHQVCMDNIKALTCKVPILCPIDPSGDKAIWVICDASASGIGAVYGQGPDWQSCRPAAFMSKKFTAAQHNYRVFEMETIAILKALLKWENKLLGNRINVVTNHRALEFFKTNAVDGIFKLIQL
jgi:RNase H-like domain found in reverse transcriptase